MLRVTAFPAAEGDCFLVEYGDPESPVRLLIDGGRSATYRDHLKGALSRVADADRRLALLVITHIDRDHIEGVLDMAEDATLPLVVEDVWFNGYSHLGGRRLPVLGTADGEKLSAAIHARGWPWNKAFGGDAVALDKTGRTVQKPLPLGAVITLLSPSLDKLSALRPRWEKECKRLGLIPGGIATPAAPQLRGLPTLGPRISLDLAAIANRVTALDNAEPNGSSIAFLFEYEDRRILFGADAHPDLLVESLRQLAGAERLGVDLLKAPHHGSRANVTSSLCEALSYSHVLITTNGKMFNHPDEEGVARLVVSSASDLCIHFNYSNSITESWNFIDSWQQHRVTASFPDLAGNGFCVIDFNRSSIARVLE